MVTCPKMACSLLQRRQTPQLSTVPQVQACIGPWWVWKVWLSFSMMLTFRAALRGSTCWLCCRRGVWLWGCRGSLIVGRLLLLYTLGHAWAALLRFSCVLL